MLNKKSKTKNIYIETQNVLTCLYKLGYASDLKTIKIYNNF